MAVYKRGNTYWFEFVFKGQRVRRSTNSKNLRNAEAIERAYRTKLEKGEVDLNPIEKTPVQTFRQAVKTFIDWSKSEHAAKPATTRRYEVSTKALLDFFGDKPLDQFTPDDFEQYKVWRVGTKKKPPTKKLKKNPKLTTKKPVSVVTVNRELACAKKLFNEAIKAAKSAARKNKQTPAIYENPVSEVKFFAEQNEHFVVLTSDEEKLYLFAASQPLQDVATLMLETGMRPEEIYRMEKQNVHLDENYYFNPFGKTKAARRKIPLTARARTVLQSRIDNADGEYLFLGRRVNGVKNPVVKLNNAHNAGRIRAGLRKFRLYDLRHTFASRMAMAGVDLVTLAALLGHSRVQMVMRYAHPVEAHKVDAVAKLENFNASRRKSG